EEAMELMNHRTALKICYFDLQREWSWYLRRTSNMPNQAILRAFLDVETRLLAPFVPFISEEIWERTDHESYVSLEPYPEPNEEDMNPAAERSEDFLKSTLDDIREILKVTRITPKKIVLYTSPKWKSDIYQMAIDLAKEDGLEMKAIMENVTDDPNLKEKAKEASQFAGSVVKDVGRMSKRDLERFGELIDERGYLEDSSEFLKSEFSCDVEVFDADDEAKYDPKSKAKFATPWRPAIFVE
ncbi:MAG: class I tRNA ligase family protein, partial [Thermoplasmata archaeon]|nr:class I tRNA ligase family protein [Thermoplasmata archaeon]